MLAAAAVAAVAAAAAAAASLVHHLAASSRRKTNNKRMGWDATRRNKVEARRVNGRLGERKGRGTTHGEAAIRTRRRERETRGYARLFGAATLGGQ